MKRETKETKVEVSINLDGTGVCSAHSQIPFLDHMLDVSILFTRVITTIAGGHFVVLTNSLFHILMQFWLRAFCCCANPMHAVTLQYSLLVHAATGFAWAVQCHGRGRGRHMD